MPPEVAPIIEDVIRSLAKEVGMLPGATCSKIKSAIDRHVESARKYIDAGDYRSAIRELYSAVNLKILHEEVCKVVPLV